MTAEQLEQGLLRNSRDELHVAREIILSDVSFESGPSPTIVKRAPGICFTTSAKALIAI